MDINQVWPEWYEDCVLGEGSFGKVYRAKRVEYGRTFYSAIKVLSVPKSQQEIRTARAQGMNDSEIYSYFQSLVGNLLNEITLMDNLKGAKNIVGIEDYKIIEREGEIGWDIFIRMELLTPFDNFISNPDFSQYHVIKLGVDICSALENCEQNQIVHRDIKPDNIFISRFGEYKLGDFGIARKLEMTQANLSKKGTLNYMAPEIYKGESYGSNVDIYSLGLVLYTLLNNNRTAFLPDYPQPITYKDNENALYQRLSGGDIPPPAKASASLGNVILKACAYNPAERYQTATEFKNALLYEWNSLSQSGYNVNPASNITAESFDREQLNRTTKDMTVNGKIVAQGYQDVESAHSAYYNSDIPDSYLKSVDNSIYSGRGRMGMPSAYGKAKSSKIARILSIPVAVATAVLSIMLLVESGGMNLQISTSIAMIAASIIILISNTNKNALGLSILFASPVYIIPSAASLFTRLSDSFPVDSLVFFICGLLMFFCGIVKATQKEDRLSASLCIYSVVIELIYSIYLCIIGNYSFDLLHIAIVVFELSTILWTYGYNRETKPEGIKKILHFISYGIVLIIAFPAVINVVNYIKVNF